MKANTDTLQKQEEEKAFQYCSYGKGELAMLYIPNIQQQICSCFSRSGLCHRY